MSLSAPFQAKDSKLGGYLLAWQLDKFFVSNNGSAQLQVSVQFTGVVSSKYCLFKICSFDSMFTRNNGCVDSEETTGQSW
jgi:hypothetical protein